jgi:hypothetical protein
MRLFLFGRFSSEIFGLGFRCLPCQFSDSRLGPRCAVKTWFSLVPHRFLSRRAGLFSRFLFQFDSRLSVSVFLRPWSCCLVSFHPRSSARLPKFFFDHRFLCDLPIWVFSVLIVCVRQKPCPSVISVPTPVSALFSLSTAIPRRAHRARRQQSLARAPVLVFVLLLVRPRPPVSFGFISWCRVLAVAACFWWSQVFPSLPGCGPRQVPCLQIWSVASLGIILSSVVLAAATGQNSFLFRSKFWCLPPLDRHSGLVNLWSQWPVLLLSHRIKRIEFF